MRIKTLLAAGLLAATATSQDCLFSGNTPPGTDLMLGDDQTVTLPLPFSLPWNGGTVDAISICSNGYVWLGVETSVDWSDSEAEFLSQGPRLAPCWDDLNPSAGGAVYYNETATQVSVVWQDVPYFGQTTNLANMELVISISGTIYFHYGANHSVHTSSAITGITVGGGATPNALDISGNPAIVGATGYELFAGGAFDLSGLTLALTPTTATDYQVSQTSLPGCPATQGPNLTPAASTTFGMGCPSAGTVPTGNWYEEFSASTLDVNNQSYLYVYAGTTYVMVPGGGWDTNFGTPVTLGDDTQVNVSLAGMGGLPFLGQTLQSIDMCSNGFFWMAPNTSNDFSPTAQEFADQGPRIAPCWMDLSPNNGGTVYWNETPAYCMGTWENVPSYGNPGTSANTFQIKFFPDGSVEVNYMTVDNNATLADEAIIGFSSGVGQPTPPVDVSMFVGGAFDIAPPPVPLTHTPDTDPVIGTSYDLTTVDAPIGSVFGATFVGFNQLNIPLGGLGAPNCTQYAENLAVFLSVLNGSTTFTHSLPVPFSLDFIGVTFISQGAVYEPSLNPLGVASSNGATGTIGT